eukprot:UN07580
MLLFARRILQKLPKQTTTIVSIQKRLKVYLVGIDDSNYGYSALKTVTQHVKENDKIISIHFPRNITVYTPTFFDEQTKQQIVEENNEQSKKIEAKCKEIVQSESLRNVEHEVLIGKATFSPGDDLVKACFGTKCDVLCVGGKGLSHGLKEAMTDRLQRVGHVADYCLHHAPCDVLVVKEEHDNV